MDPARVCQQCGSTVSATARRGLCPGCLAKLAAPGASRANGPSDASRPGARSFGDYELLGELAAGGMGVVYLAQQVSLKRAVALKMIRSGNLATAAEVQRFRTEAEAAANLDHPHIVPIYEIGEHEGQHYFSMKLIEGGDLGELNAACQTRDSEWVRRSAQRVATMARAVHHAHQRGVLHRDIKPTNILLDEEGQPHLTDFGLAKLAQQGRDLTQTIAILGTPHYMAPEQAAGKAREVTIAADIYSLGAVFFELLAGRPVFEGDSPLEILRKAQETEPPTLRKLNPAVDSDVETICRKCLEKEPRSRYDSADALAEDLEHWLAGEPIRARAVTRLEQLRKWSHRNPMLATLIVAVVVSLLSGVIGIVSQWRRAEAEADRAKQSARLAGINQAKAEFEAAKSRHVAQFMADMLAGVGPKVALGRDTKLLHEILDNTVERIGKDLKDQPEVEAELRATMAETYLQLGDVAKAESLQRQALRLRRSLFGDSNIVTAASLTHLARVLVNRGLPADLSEAEKMAREALVIRAKLSGSEHPEIASALYVLASALQRQGKLAEAEDTHRRALTIRRNLLGDHADTASSLNNLALVLRDRGKKSEAETAVREALAMQRKVLGDEHPDVALSLKNLAAVLRDEGNLTDAESAAREALALQKKLLQPGHPEIGAAMERLADILVRQNKATEAEPVYRELLALKKKLLGDDHTEVAGLLNNLSIVLRKKDKIEDAEVLDREALAMRRRLFGNQHLEVVHSLDSLARTKIEQFNDAEAEALYRESLAIRRKLQGNEHLGVATVLSWLSPVLRRQGKLVEAEAVAREALALRIKGLPPGDPAIGNTIANLAEALRDQHKWTEAESIITEALANRRKISGDAHPAVAAWLISLASVKQGQGKLTDAEALFREAIALLKKLHGNTHREVEKALAEITKILQANGKLAEAEVIQREELAMERRLSGADHPFVANSLVSLGVLLKRQNKTIEAEEAFREALVIRRKRIPDAVATIANALEWLAVTLDAQNKFAESEPLWREVLLMRQKLSDRAETARVLLWLAENLNSQQNFAEAEQRCREALAIRRELLEFEDIDLTSPLLQLSRVLLSVQKFAEAESLARECFQIYEKHAPGQWGLYKVRGLIGASLLGQKKYEAAERALLSAYFGMKEREATMPARAKSATKEALEHLVELYEATAQPEKLAEWKQKLADWNTVGK